MQFLTAGVTVCTGPERENLIRYFLMVCSTLVLCTASRIRDISKMFVICVILKLLRRVLLRQDVNVSRPSQILPPALDGKGTVRMRSV
jgi:hypothetical protein